jgi:hypothetical protein
MSFSQDSSSKVNSQITFRPFQGWRMNGHSLTSKEFKNEIYKVPPAIPVFNKATTNRAISFGLMVPMGIFTLLASQAPEVGSPRFGKNNNEFLIAAFITGGFSWYFLSHSQKQYKKAAMLHNAAFQ